MSAVSEISECNGKTTGGVSAFARDPKTGDLKRLNQQPSNGDGPCHRVVDHTGKNVLVANYGGRVPEALFSSTSAMAKQFDVMIAASQEVLTNLATSSGCSGVALVQNNQLTRDGISCILGKPAREEHVALANNLITQATDPVTGQRLAISALLEAAHACE